MLESYTATFFSLLALFGLSAPAPSFYQGYVEGEYILASSQLAGQIATRDVVRGQNVKKGDLLYTLESESEKASLEGAEAQTAQSQASLDDLLKAKRKPELDTLIAQRTQAEAALKLAKINVERDEKLVKTNAVSQSTLDTERATKDQAQGKLEETEAALALGQQSLGRDDAIKAAEAALLASKASATMAKWKLDQKTVTAPTDAFVFDTLYDTGETVAAGQGVISLLPPEKVKVRFFVKATDLPSFTQGQKIQILDSSTPSGASLEKQNPIEAKITYISPRAEYTPPQLYNRDNRERLLFMLEAEPLTPSLRLHPGEPVDVVPPKTP